MSDPRVLPILTDTRMMEKTDEPGVIDSMVRDPHASPKELERRKHVWLFPPSYVSWQGMTRRMMIRVERWKLRGPPPHLQVEYMLSTSVVPDVGVSGTLLLPV